VDEAEEFRDEVAFDTIDFSVRSIDIPNRVTLIMNPQDTDHFIWRKWFDGYTEYVTIDGAQIPMSTHPEVLHIHSTYLNNLDNIPKGYFEKIMHLRLTNRAKYEHLFLGKWREQAEGAVFPNWVEGPFDMSLPYAYGLDYGYFPDPLALVRVAVDTAARRIYLHEEIYATELSTDNTVKQVLSIAGRERMVIADTSEPRLTAGIAAAGVNIQKADKGPDSIINSLKAMQDYQIVVTPESHNLKRELNTYIWNDKKSSTPVDANNHCFVGSTQVETINGNKSIESIAPGDLVKTSQGYNRVLKRWNNGLKQVKEYTLQFDTFSLSLVCTSDHLIKTNQGWTRVSELKSGVTVYLSKSSMEKYSGYTPANGISPEAQQGCTLLSGNTITAKFLKDTMCITKMKTLGITGLKTLSASQQANILASTAKNGLKKILNGLNLFIPLELQRRLNGTEARKAGNGTGNTERKCISYGNMFLWLVTYAGKHTKQNTQQEVNFAPTLVNPHTAAGLVLTTKQGSASLVEANLLQTNIQKFNVVAVNVGQTKESKVYDLTVEGQHEYFANGVLVHNCMDSARYCFTRLAEGSDVSAWA
jgi:phage terminase large subunit